MKAEYDCIVIGNGPGGLLSALYLKRYKRSVLLIGNGEPRARWIPHIRNLVGHSDSPTGKQLLRRLHDQVENLDVPILACEARVNRCGHGFEVRAGERKLYARKVILATGMEDVEPPVKNWPELRRSGLLGYCPICDGFDHSKDPVALLVQDAHGLKKIPFIYKLSPNLTIVKVKRFAIPPVKRKLIQKLGLRVLRGRNLRLRAGAKHRLKISFSGVKPVEVKLAYVALGTHVRDEAFNGLRGLKRTREGFIIASPHQETSVKGLYAVGDCVNALSQVSVAAGHAAIAATRVHNDLGFA